MKKTTLIGLFIIFLGIITGIIYFSLKPTQPKNIIAVVTTLSHPALDMARAGFVQEIKAKFGSEYIIKDYNAEASMQSANLIARQIAQDTHVVGIFALGSLAAQTLSKAEKTRPIVIAAVSDPEAILSAQNTNICGLTDSIDADYQINTILDLLPDTKIVSLLYSPHETNSASSVLKLEKSLIKHNLKAELVGVYEPQQIASASLRACQKGDVVLIPLDNQLAASMPSVIKATNQANCVVILSDKVLLHHGAAISFGVDYQKSGEEAAKLMIDILTNKQSPAQIKFVNPKEIGVFVNQKIISEKNIKLNPNSQTKIIQEKL